MTEEVKPATEETREIDDKVLDQVVGGGLASIPVGNVVKAPGTSSFGGEEWEKR